MDFLSIKNAVNKQFSKMCSENDRLFRTEAPKEGMWDKYLGSFPVGTNPVFRERTEHDCNCCKQFIRAIGNVVAIKEDDSLVSIWDCLIDVPAYQHVASMMADYVKSFPIDNVFAHYKSKAGTDFNYEASAVTPIKWNHFFVNIPTIFVQDKILIDSYLGERKSLKDVFERSLDTINKESCDVVIELINQGALYRGEEFLAIVKRFRKHAGATRGINYAWRNIDEPTAILRLKNTSIGSLLSDISEGMPLEDAVKQYESKVAPTNYKRPKSLVTSSMVEKARKAVSDLGLESALARRYATLDDINVKDILFISRTGSAIAEKDLFNDIAVSKPKEFGGCTEVSIKDFLENILPTTKSIELYMENSYVNNLVTLTTGVDATAPRLFKWDNPFAWSYNGEVTDSIKERVKAAGGDVTGELCFRLSWNNYDDLDLHMKEPDGNEIYYRQKISQRSGGKLDVDMNAGGRRQSREPVENIVYPTISRMPAGSYLLYVHNFVKVETKDEGFEVDIDFHGELTKLTYTKPVGNHASIIVANIQKGIDGSITITPRIDSNTVVKEVWGIKTNTFNKVKLLLTSPNHWEAPGIGNLHYMFILDDCKNPDDCRGFYNEFLKPELDEHRKVLELLGNAMMASASDNQLSGVGFSSTKRSSVILRVTGATKRLIKINF